MSEGPEPEEIADQMDGFDPDPSEGEQAAAGPEMGPQPGPGPGQDYQPQTTFGQVVQALQSTSPHEQLETIESPFDPVNGAEKRIFRGVKKMTNTEGQPAWLDLVIGMSELLMRERFNLDQRQESNGDQEGEEIEGDQLSPDERLEQMRRQ